MSKTDRPGARAGSDADAGDAPAAAKLIWRFEGYVLDERGPSLSRDGKALECQVKPLAVLIHLLEHAGEVVTKDELLEHCWPGRIPSESVLTTAMTKLREVLDDADQRLVKTVYGYGYRFAASVQRAAVDGADPLARDFRIGDAPPQRPLWKLAEKLGAGGETWLARHAKTGEARVFKFAPDAAALRQIKREITLFRLLEEHPAARGSYRRLLDWNLVEPPFFIEAEYLAGGSLQQWIERCGGWSAVTLTQRLELAVQIACALDVAHQAGVLHKDLKPANILIDDAVTPAQVRLADFGSGGLLDRERLAELGFTQLGFTQTVGALSERTRGTLLYAAPEVLGGAMPTLQSDIYSLGVILYQIIVGDWSAILAPGWERGISDELLREDIAACTDQSPPRRLAGAALLAQRLQTLEARRAQRVALAAEREESERLRRRVAQARARRPWVAALLGAMVIGIAASSLFAWRAEQSRKAANHHAAMQEAASEFLSRILGAGDPLLGVTGPDNMAARAVVDRAAAEAAGSFADQPEQEAVVRLMIGNVY
ncbi:MAG TPA: winged helix-turn-helix domain-containing protein, partial [Nevskiaceae bacterium]|nr:winged helix-turn-helix domain-containing protein [Nevskiaceae bacterium]